MTGMVRATNETLAWSGPWLDALPRPVIALLERFYDETVAPLSATERHGTPGRRASGQDRVLVRAARFAFLAPARDQQERVVDRESETNWFNAA